MMIFSACDSGWLPWRLAASRPCQICPTIAGRQCRREKRAPRKPSTEWASSGWRQAFHQPDRIDQEGADDRRIEAFVVQHQHRVVQSRPRIHHVAAGAGFRRHFAEVGRDVAGAVHSRNVEVAEGRHRAAVAVRRQAVDGGAFQQGNGMISVLWKIRVTSSQSFRL